MQHPFQQLNRVRTSSGHEYLVAALGSKILLANEQDSSVAEWTNSQSNADPEEEQEPPAKKQKIEVDTTLSNIIILSSSRAGDALVAVSEDKSLIVLTTRDGSITESSCRAMPKRPSAIQVLDETNTILCADKFGDVYALPLFPEHEWPYSGLSSGPREISEDPNFKPSANELTVHSQRNLNALKSQKVQKNFTPRKAPLAFEHKLVLGHVSMLTDMLFIHGFRAKQRIITADRDEHIRVSRPLPQAYVIEGYCLGHTEYVSKLCALQDSDLLLSGGGDNWLGLWDYTTYQLKHKIDLRTALSSSQIGLTSDTHIAISLLKEISISQHSDHFIIAAVSGRMPAIIIISLNKKDLAVAVSVTNTSSSVLDIQPVGSRVVVSLDPRTSQHDRLQAYKLRDVAGSFTLQRTETSSVLEKLNVVNLQVTDPKRLESTLYATSNLRKRRGWGDRDEEEPE